MAVVITTIHDYSDTSIGSYEGVPKIVIGDLKTNHQDYKNRELVYLHPTEYEDFGRFARMLPYNHYSRKNLGYLRAMAMGSRFIFDTDDDTFPKSNFKDFSKDLAFLKITKPATPNVLSLYTGLNIWARGYPLELVQNKSPVLFSQESSNIREQVGIYQSIVEGDPDVDAVFRLTNPDFNQRITFREGLACVFERGVYGQGNTQGTFWVDPKLYHLLYIPSTVSFRFCDILKMYVAQRCMWEYGKLFCYLSPIVYQKRNQHDYMEDFKSEYPMYVSVLRIIDQILPSLELKGDPSDLLLVYSKLYQEGIVQEREVEIVKEWLSICQQFGSCLTREN
jgi:hypothetical protein